MVLKFTYKIFLFSTTIFLLSCNHAAQNSKAYTAAFASEEPKRVLQESDEKFLMDAYLQEHFILQMATEALYRSTAPETVNLAKEMVNVSQNNKARLSAIADDFQLDVASDMMPEQKQVWKELVKKKGWEFDKHFSDATEQLSASTNKLYSNAESQLQNEELKIIANERIASLQQQTALATIQKEKVIARTLLVNKELSAQEIITKK